MKKEIANHVMRGRKRNFNLKEDFLKLQNYNINPGM